jgi:hypothetical protein
MGWVRVLTRFGVTITRKCSTSCLIGSREMPLCPTWIPARRPLTGTGPQRAASRPRGGCAGVPGRARAVAEPSGVGDARQDRPRYGLAERFGGAGIVALKSASLRECTR